MIADKKALEEKSVSTGCFMGPPDEGCTLEVQI